MAILGLLETDVLYDDLIPDYGSYGQMFADFFGKIDGSLTYRYYQVQQGELPQRAEECDAYLITGSKAAAYDATPWVAQLQNWIAEFHPRGARMIGICFGHQLIAHSLGGKAAISEKGWGVGVLTSHLVTNIGEPVRQPKSSLRLLHSHQDQVQKLPPTAQLLATSDFCPNAAFSIDSQVLSFQGHPEFTPQYLQRLLSRRRETIGEAVYSRAIATIHQPTDARLVGHWLLRFIHHK
jgi:GMP synthase-like glutamine amidotransferase